MNSRVLLGVPFLLLLFMHLVGCDTEPATRQPDIVRVGVLPDDSPAALRLRNGKFLSYLSEALDVDFDLRLSNDYEELLRSFGDGELDLVFFGGFTFVRAQDEFGAQPLVMRDIDLKFTSYFIARQGTPGESIADFRGQRLSFGSRLSTSGHLMPRHFLRAMNIDPEKFFREVSYSGSHDMTATSVRDGLVDMGAVNANVFQQLLLDGRLEREATRVVWVTPPYPDYTWAVQRGIDEEFAIRLRDAALALDMTDPIHAEILQAMGAGGFVPSLSKDFDILRGIIHELD